MNTVYKFVILSCLLILTTVVYTQNNSDIEKSKSENIVPEAFNKFELAKFNSIPELKLPESYKSLQSNPLPAILDNSNLPFFRPVFNQVSLECGQASGIGQGFTYEMNYARNLDGSNPDNQYPTHFAWNFANSGYAHGVSFFDTWEILRGFGTPDVTTYGGMYIPGGGPRQWIDGYNYYYEGMKNRINGVYAIPFDTEEGFLTLKYWLFDHLENASAGGVANFYANVPPIVSLPAGTPEAGKPCVIQWGNYASHGMTIVGWNDSIRYDYNGDGQYTNNIDINGDGLVTMKDWEMGAFRFANNYAGGPNWGDNGFAYMMYRNLAFPNNQGGMWSQKAYVVKTREEVDPVLTMKIKIRHTSRNKIKVYAGMSIDTTSTTPEFTKDYPIFNYQGGDYHMIGDTTEISKVIEFGLDISEFLNELDSGQSARYFLLIDEDDPSSVGTGDLIDFSLINYNNSGTEVPLGQSNIPLIEDGLSSFSIVTSVNFSRPVIVTDSLPQALVNDPYIAQMVANGGEAPYFWELDQDYEEDLSIVSYPLINAIPITPSNFNTGSVAININFSFPFYENSFDEVIMHTDGYLLFDENLFNWPYLVNSEWFFLTKKRIAPFGADLMYNTSLGHGMWYEGNSGFAHFRWKGYFYNEIVSNTVDFGVRIYSDGKIEFYFGEMLMPSNYEWLSAIYSGNLNQIQEVAINDSITISNGTKIDLKPSFFPDGLFITADGYVKGTPTVLTPPTPIRIKVTDASDLVTRKEIFYSTSGINSLIVQNVEVIAGGDIQVEAGENAVISLEVRNVVTDTIYNSNMIISSTNPAVQLIDSVEYVGDIAAGDTLLLSNSFEFVLTQIVENLSLLDFETIIYSATDTFVSHFDLPSIAPDIVVTGVVVDDGGNGFLDPGESTNLIVYIENIGESAATNVSVNFSSVDPLFYITNPTASAAILQPNQSVSVVLNVYISSLAQLLTSLTIDFSADWGYSSSDTEYLNLIFLGDDFESGNFSQLTWMQGGDDQWLVDDTVVYEGTYSARSGYIVHNEESNMSVELNVGAPGQIGFFKKVSSEPNYDYLRFYIDGTQIESWAGNNDWSHVSFPIGQGIHVLNWSYTKDYSVDGGSDAGWIDYVTFPVLEELFVSIDDIVDPFGDIHLVAYPNPFNVGSVLEFEIESPEIVSLNIFDLHGKLVRILMPLTNVSVGKHSILWDGRDSSGNILPPGIYIARISTNMTVSNIQLVKMK